MALARNEPEHIRLLQPVFMIDPALDAKHDTVQGIDGGQRVGIINNHWKGPALTSSLEAVA